jgi:SAM-dependent methyltransferase
MNEPDQPEFWNARYEADEIPWDFGGVPAALREYLRPNPRAPRPAGPRTVLIPGCGSGYEIVAFAEAGFEVTALDFSPAAVACARRIVGPALAARVVLGDFFTARLSAAPFDIIYERTFLCSFSPARRAAYERRVADLVKPGGAFVGYFYFDKIPYEEGPPFGLAWGEADELFGEHFLLVKDEPVGDSLPLFAGRERWLEHRRTRAP